MPNHGDGRARGSDSDFRTGSATTSDPDPDRLAERLAAVERALAGDGAVADLSGAAQLNDRLDAAESDLDALCGRVDRLAAAVEALRGYVGAARAADGTVERRADLALAKAERLERALVGRRADSDAPDRPDADREPPLPAAPAVAAAVPPRDDPAGPDDPPATDAQGAAEQATDPDGEDDAEGGCDWVTEPGCAAADRADRFAAGGIVPAFERFPAVDPDADAGDDTGDAPPPDAATSRPPVRSRDREDRRDGVESAVVDRLRDVL